MLIAVMQSWGESRHNVPGKSTHFYKIQRPEENVICHDNGKEESPTGFEPQSFPLTSQHYVFSSSPVYSLPILTRGRGHMF